VNQNKIIQAINNLGTLGAQILQRLDTITDELHALNARLQSMDIDEGQFGQHALRVRDQTERF
jgi:uncharacterized protein YPO0396